MLSTDAYPARKTARTTIRRAATSDPITGTQPTADQITVVAAIQTQTAALQQLINAAQVMAPLAPAAIDAPRKPLQVQNAGNLRD